MGSYFPNQGWNLGHPPTPSALEAQSLNDWTTWESICTYSAENKDILLWLGFPGGSDGKASAYNEGELGSIPGLERSPGEENGNPLRYSCLQNSMDRGALQITVQWCPKELDMTEHAQFLRASM